MKSPLSVSLSFGPFAVTNSSLTVFGNSLSSDRVLLVVGAGLAGLELVIGMAAVFGPGSGVPVGCLLGVECVGWLAGRVAGFFSLRLGFLTSGAEGGGGGGGGGGG